jgi:hypothetical protein
MNTNPETPPSNADGYVKGAGGCLLLGVILFGLFVDLMGGGNFIQWCYHLGFGFIAYFQRLTLSPAAIGALISCLILAGVLIHFGLPRLLRKRQKDLTWSLGRSLVFLLLCSGLVLAVGGGGFALKHLPSKGDLVPKFCKKLT